MSIFLCFILDAYHCSENYLQFIKNDTICLTLECVTLGCVGVFMHQQQTSFCSHVPQAVMAILNFLWCMRHCDSLSRKTVSDLAGIRSYVVFNLPLIKEP